MQNSFGTVGFPNVLVSVGGVGDQIDALHLRQRDLPVGVAAIRHHLTELMEGEQHLVESRERELISVCDLEDGHASRIP